MAAPIAAIVRNVLLSSWGTPKQHLAHWCFSEKSVMALLAGLLYWWRFPIRDHRACWLMCVQVGVFRYSGCGLYREHAVIAIWVSFLYPWMRPTKRHMSDGHMSSCSPRRKSSSPHAYCNTYMSLQMYHQLAWLQPQHSPACAVKAAPEPSIAVRASLWAPSNAHT